MHVCDLHSGQRGNKPWRPLVARFRHDPLGYRVLPVIPDVNGGRIELAELDIERSPGYIRHSAHKDTKPVGKLLGGKGRACKQAERSAGLIHDHTVGIERKRGQGWQQALAPLGTTEHPTRVFEADASLFVHHKKSPLTYIYENDSISTSIPSTRSNE